MKLPLFFLAIFPLFSEPLQFNFPPSQYQWQIAYNDRDVSDDGSEESLIQIFAHREGDALEIFAATLLKGSEKAPGLALVQEIQKDPEMVQFVEDTLSALQFALPNHRINLVRFQESENESIVGWECIDDQTDLLHGYVRVVHDKTSTAIFHYFTTAPISEANHGLWINFLQHL